MPQDYYGHPPQDAPRLGYNSASAATDSTQEDMLEGLFTGLLEQAGETSQSVKRVFSNMGGGLFSSGFVEAYAPESPFEVLKQTAQEAADGIKGLLGEGTAEGLVRVKDELIGDTAHPAWKMGEAGRNLGSGIGTTVGNAVGNVAYRAGQAFRGEPQHQMPPVLPQVTQGLVEGSATDPEEPVSPEVMALVDQANQQMEEGGAVNDETVGQIVAEGVRKRAAASGQPLTEEEEDGFLDKVMGSLADMKEGEKIDLMQAGIAMLAGMSNPDTPAIGIIGQGLQAGIGAANQSRQQGIENEQKEREIGAREKTAEAAMVAAGARRTSAMSSTMKNYLETVGAPIKGEMGRQVAAAYLQSYNLKADGEDLNNVASLIRATAEEIMMAAGKQGRELTVQQAMDFAIKHHSNPEDPNALFEQGGLFTNKLRLNTGRELFE